MIRKILNIVIDSSLPVQSSIYPNPFTKPETLSLGWLSNVSPCFPVSASNISILNEPKEFYSELLDLTATAKDRITLASLYLGNGDLEGKLVTALMQNPNLNNININILLDYSRGSRLARNSRVMLIPLLQKKPTANLSLYHTPNLRGVLKKVMPNRWNELVGVQHMKLYIFDDTLLISGANLSNDYFTNRQDRYYVIKDKYLCDFYEKLVGKVQEFSVKIDANNEEHVNKEWGWPFEGNKYGFIKKAGDSIEQYLQESLDEQNSYKQEGFDTWVFPLVQMGQLGIEQDLNVTDRLISEAAPGAKLNIATAYFNLTQEYIDSLISNSKATCNVLLAHPKANGFLGAKGMAGGIPDGYTLFAKRFQEKLSLKGQDNRIILNEYLKEGWTYHAKGLWYYPQDTELPSLTMIGSPNFGNRSVLKDLESQVAIVTENQDLRKRLHDECSNLYRRGLPGDFSRDIPKWVYLMVFMFRDFFLSNLFKKNNYCRL